MLRCLICDTKLTGFFNMVLQLGAPFSWHRSQAPRNHRTGSCLRTPRVTTGMFECWTINQKPTRKFPWCLVTALNNFAQEDPFADLRKQEEDPWFVQSTRSLHIFTSLYSLPKFQPLFGHCRQRLRALRNRKTTSKKNSGNSMDPEQLQRVQRTWSWLIYPQWWFGILLIFSEIGQNRPNDGKWTTVTVTLVNSNMHHN